ncbi:hypothetical protein V0R50_20120 [Pseudomonas sp. 148P]|uniref:Uncharacterized protein n=1 Tax=Pseudomonas ulcerans TaxID=3115852 RepID=A0ABU7HVF4_9PSED|nr:MULTISPECIES: hypothetical protein [unclassified Pseudomonas]MEE1924128.1 hypothetical protein [Pseudomonas sp. 147P]MEE1935545.1 hypothetical protein [Pseudomonas sp. 148P]
MAHELGAANHGFVWPRIIFAADGESVNVWAEQKNVVGQSVQYLYGLETPHAVPLAAFSRKVETFIDKVISRLNALGHQPTELAEWWALIREDQEDPEALRYRILEAKLGYDPDECPQHIIDEALALQTRIGVTAMAELAPVYKSRISEISAYTTQCGIRGKPEISAERFAPVPHSQKPWQRGANSAKALRALLGKKHEPIRNTDLYDLLGVARAKMENWSPYEGSKAAIAEPLDGGFLNYLPRKKHPDARRFELARLIGEVMDHSEADKGWLVSSDIATATQKRQRSFAAEFLCPIDALVDFLGGNFSESSREDAAVHFNVSDKTIESLLANNGHSGFLSNEPKVPYQVHA